MYQPVITMAKINTQSLYYRKMIKAIEKCSLQATFGPEITSTTDLLRENPDRTSDITIKAQNNGTIESVEKQEDVDTIHIASAQLQLNAADLPNHPTNKYGKIQTGLVANNSELLVASGSRHVSFPSVSSISGWNIPAISDYENAVALPKQSNFLGPVPPEIRGHKASYHARVISTKRFTNISLLPDRRASPMDRHTKNLPRYS